VPKSHFSEIRQRSLLRDEIRLAIVEKINRGELSPGDRLSSETELARQLNVSRNSVREALQALERDGLIEKRHGVGTFVTESLPLLRGGIERLMGINEFIAMHGWQPESHVVSLKRINADQKQAKAFNVAPSTMFYEAKMLKTVNGEPAALCIDTFPSTILLHEVTLASFGSSIFDFLEEHGVSIAYADCDIMACSAGEAMGALFQVSPDKPLLLFDQTHYDRLNNQVLHSKTYFLTDKIRFNIVRRR
jgi:GntR family transcriptional regulator